jgi:two-component system chemotaxis response regulator CheB
MTENGNLVRAVAGAGTLSVERAEDGARFARGGLYVAQPGFHLLLGDGVTLLRRGPRENMMRPAIDPLFRSAAIQYGPRVIGVILSGTLCDGAAGLGAIRRCGGKAVVQDPREAAFPGMPAAALAGNDVAHVAPLDRIAPLLARLTAEEAGPDRDRPEELRWEAAMAAGHVDAMDGPDTFGEHSVFTCPECHGPLWELRGTEALPRFRCYQGHAYGLEMLFQARDRGVEQALWSALRAHRERAALVRRMAETARRNNHRLSAQTWDQRAAEHEEDAELIRRVLEGHGRHGDIDEPPVLAADE